MHFALSNARVYPANHSKIKIGTENRAEISSLLNEAYRKCMRIL